MKTSRVVLCNRLGLHARAASKLVNTAAGFESEVWLVRDGRRVNAKSIMGVLMLAAPVDTELEIECAGPDEDEALAALVALVEDRFGEGE
ncbi:MAG: HPr family phosphocarrier protein [Wenzhouxiangellaceae bacterium]|nr:HPr family phosphocarrier protein [Wenzhouxiangellaceae bacterium]